MTSVIAAQALPAYLRLMTAALIRFLMVVALALMPFGVASAPAVAADVSASASAGHCDDDGQPTGAPATMDMHCATCAALPAVETAEVRELRPEAPVLIAATDALTDTEPEIATPPPKLA